MKNKKNGIKFFYRSIFSLLLLIPLTGFAQDFPTKKIDVNYRDKELKEVFKDLTDRIGIDFLYNLDQLKNHKPITLEMQNATLQEILDHCFSGTTLGYKMVDGVIVIAVSSRPVTTISARQVTGVIKGEDGLPLPGATVTVKNTTIGAASDIEGRFTLNIPSDEHESIVVTFIGMKSEEIKIHTETTELNIVMKEEEVVIDEFVVTGYTAIRKESFTGDYTSVSREQLLQVSPSNILDALQVFDPSLRMEQNNEMGSDPNTLPEFMLRGRSGMPAVSDLDKLEASGSSTISRYSLVNNPNMPLFILDGFETNVEKIFDLDIHRIENITILKDAAATAIYGSRAANGVIVITTVAPKAGQFRFYYSLTGSVTAPDLTSYNLMNAEEKLRAEVLTGLLDGSDAAQISEPIDKRMADYNRKSNMVKMGVNTYWLSKPLKVAVNHDHSFNIEGGSEALRLGLNIRYGRQDGIMKGSKRDRINFGLNVLYAHKQFRVRNNTTYDNVMSENSPWGNFSYFTRLQPYDAPYDPITGYVNQFLPEYMDRRSMTERLNPFYEIRLNNFSDAKSNTFTNNTAVSWRIKNHFEVKVDFAISYGRSDSRDFTDPSSARYMDIENIIPINERGELILNDRETYSWNTNIFTSYTNTINHHNISASLGINARSNKETTSSALYKGFPSGVLHDPAFANTIDKKPSFSDNHTRLMGAFFASNYSYKNIYLFDASIRLDGSSEFGTESKTSTFWSLGTGINFHYYDFFKEKFRRINRFKIAVNYGVTGKANFPPYVARHMYNIDVDTWYGTGIGGSLVALGNKKLKWERNKSWNALADITLLNDALNFKFSIYKKNTVDMISRIGIPSSSGFLNYYENMGEVENTGREYNISYRYMHPSSLGFSVFANMATNKNILVKLSPAMEAENQRIDKHFSEYHEYAHATQDQSKFSVPVAKYIKGQPTNIKTGMKSLGINPADGREVYEKRDGTMTYEWNSYENQPIGYPDPEYQGSFGINIFYKGFSVTTTFMYHWGGQLYNMTLIDKVENAPIYKTNIDRRILSDRWQKPGDVAKFKSIRESNVSTRPSSRFIEDDNTLKFNSLTVNYDVNKNTLKKWKISMLRFQFNMKDIATISSVKQERGTSYPFARTFNFSINTTF